MVQRQPGTRGRAEKPQQRLYAPKLRIFTVWPFTEKVCQTLTSVMEGFVSRTKLCPKSNDKLLNGFKQRTDTDLQLPNNNSDCSIKGECERCRMQVGAVTEGSWTRDGQVK